VWDIKSESLEGNTTVEDLPAVGSPMFIEYPTPLDELVRKTCTSTTDSCTDTDPTKVTLGASESGAVPVIDQEGLSVGGKSIVRREITSNGEEELYIGENSLVTMESNGVQKLYATDATGKKIPINITESSNLQINGVSVQGQVDQQSTDIQINHTAIQRNTEAIDAVRSNVNELGSGVAGAAALTAALSALPAASSDAPLSCGVGTGGYSSRYAMGFGCATRLSERLSLNAGGSVLFGGASCYGGGTLDTVAGRAGFVFKLGNLASSSSPSKLQSKLQELETPNAALSAQLEVTQSRMAALEAMAMGHR
jgi:hypothetical protein